MALQFQVMIFERIEIELRPCVFGGRRGRRRSHAMRDVGDETELPVQALDLPCAETDKDRQRDDRRDGRTDKRTEETVFRKYRHS